MLYAIYTVVFLLTTTAIVRWYKYKPMSPLLPKKYNFGKRRNTFRCALKWLEEHDGKVLVETGVARMGLLRSKSDGASTILFGTWAKSQGHDKGIKLNSVDISEQNVAICQKTVADEGLDDYVELNVNDSIAYLQSFEQSIDLLYLDSYDYNKKDLNVIQASQEHHLKEIMAAEKNLHDKSIVLIDDCKLPGGGKGRLAIDYLLERGWKILKNQYQVALVRC